MIIDISPKSLTEEVVCIPWAQGFEFFDEDTYCWLYQIPFSALVPLSEIIITSIPFAFWSDLWEIFVATNEEKDIVNRLTVFLDARGIKVIRANRVISDRSTSYLKMDVYCKNYASHHDGHYDFRVGKDDAKLAEIERDLRIEFTKEYDFTSHSYPGPMIRRNQPLWRLFHQADLGYPVCHEEKIVVLKGGIKLPAEAIERLKRLYAITYKIEQSYFNDFFGFIYSDMSLDLIRIFALHKGLGIIPVVVSSPNLSDSIKDLTSIVNKTKYDVFIVKSMTSKDPKITHNLLLIKDKTLQKYPVDDEEVFANLGQLIRDKKTLVRYNAN